MIRRYEVVYIFDSGLTEEQVNEHLTRFHALLATPDHPNPVTQTNHWGKRQLAYAIKGRDSGYYVVVQFESRGDLLPEFERAVKLEEAVIRYLLVNNEGETARPATVRSADGEEGEMAEVDE